MADAPFGTSFGNPSRYMGQSQIGQAIKSGLLAYGIKQSGLTDWLDKLNKNSKPDVNIPGSAVPSTAIADQGQLPAVPQAPADMDWGTMASAMPPPNAAPVAPVGMAPAAAPEVQAPAQTVQPQPEPSLTPNELGKQFMSGQISSFVNPQAQRDIPVDMGGGYTQQLGSGNDYQKVPGYGKLQKFASMMGMA